MSRPYARWETTQHGTSAALTPVRMTRAKTIKAWVHAEAGRARGRGHHHRHSRDARGRRIQAARQLVEDTEATEMVNAIKVAQESFHAETGQYDNISGGLGLGFLYPQATPNTTTGTVWGATCGVCGDPAAWQKLPVHASGAMRFGYATMAGAVSQPLPTPPVTAVTFPNNSQLTGDRYVFSAMGDTDANGIYCTVVGVSWQKDLPTSIRTENENEHESNS